MKEATDIAEYNAWIDELFLMSLLEEHQRLVILPPQDDIDQVAGTVWNIKYRL